MKKTNSEVLSDFVKAFEGYGYQKRTEVLDSEIDQEDAYVFLDCELGECPPITVAVIYDEHNSRGLIIKTAIEIYPYTDKLVLLEMLNSLNNYMAHTKYAIEEKEDEYFLTLSQTHLLSDNPDPKLHLSAINDVKDWKEMVKILIEDNYISTDDQSMALFCSNVKPFPKRVHH